MFFSVKILSLSLSLHLHVQTCAGKILIQALPCLSCPLKSLRNYQQLYTRAYLSLVKDHHQKGCILELTFSIIIH